MNRPAVRMLLPAALTAGLVVLVPVAPAAAHEHRHVGALSFTVGWAEEPAVGGFRNKVSLLVEREVGGEEVPVEGVKATVVVIFGDRKGTQKTEPLDMRPAFGRPGEYLATIVPTRAGTYTFRFTGSIGGSKFNQYFTSGEDTFNDVESAGDLEFPVKDPTRGELAERAERLEGRLVAAQSAADKAGDDADSAGTLGIVGIALGGAGLLFGLVALALGGKRRRA